MTSERRTNNNNNNNIYVPKTARARGQKTHFELGDPGGGCQGGCGGLLGMK